MKGMSLDSLKELFSEELNTLTPAEKAEAAAIAADLSTHPVVDVLDHSVEALKADIEAAADKGEVNPYIATTIKAARKIIYKHFTEDEVLNIKYKGTKWGNMALFCSFIIEGEDGDTLYNLNLLEF